MKKFIKKYLLFLAVCMALAGCGASQTASEETAMGEDAGTVEQEAETMAEAGLTEGSTEVTPASQEEAASEETVSEESSSEVVEKAEKATDPKGENSADMKTVSENSMEESSKDALEEFVVTSYDEAKTMYATIALNIRKGPGTDYEVIGHLAKAQSAEVTGQADNGWYQIKLNGEAAYVSHRYMSETKVEEQAPVQPAIEVAPPAQQAEAQPAQQTTGAQTSATATVAVAPAGVIMVGDSRCVQMQAAVGGGGCSWVCENSKEYTWFVEKAIPKFDQYVGNGTKVVINMGVNDPEHYKQYVETINAKAAEWAQRGAKTYLVSVNPVWENPYTDQEDVDTFNANVPGMLSGVTWIDTSSWLITNGYRLLDGLHYDDPTYVNIFNLIMGSL